MKPGNAEKGFDRLRFGGFRTLFVHEWDVVGRDDSRDVADYDAWNAFNRLLSGAYVANTTMAIHRAVFICLACQR